MPLDLHVFRTLSDNAGALIRDPATGACAAVDAPDAGQVLAEAKAKGWAITDIFVTHAHADHTQGVAALKRATGATVCGPADAAASAPLDRVVGEGDIVRLGGDDFEIWHTPGHAPGHLSFVSRSAKLAFVGDVVFVMGCGRVQPGQMAAMWTSLSRLMALPGDTRLLGGHDYTLSNARFAAAMEPANAVLAAKLAEAEAAKAEGHFWALTSVAEEAATNPFFRAGEAALAAAVGLAGAAPGDVFAALREAKNRF
ncbi:hydroxyacylglutathione hydrolase [Bosea sp. (in: a-proteobacteria)]|uniref:hydroxyacylglutathione hydrolase n=1 Tax=Bosea sp. (in: a-proteobacteria) TaxID=1871050 RepID=UPI0027367DD3|nr:hydroxyacylglutathione hydrolase [Bosea sp. (in: a-proteobacteria)]MDP3408732.1 hydroxyacylglutathione hydrolase [Bosea sp. (in: a-proteobacteria)]